MGLAHEPLVGRVDYHGAAPGLDDFGHGLAQGVDGAVDIGVNHQFQLFVADVEQGIGAVYACVGYHAVEAPELLDGRGHGAAEHAVAVGQRRGELAATGGIDVHESHIPALGMELAHGGRTYSRCSAGNKYCFHDANVAKKW